MEREHKYAHKIFFSSFFFSLFSIFMHHTYIYKCEYEYIWECSKIIIILIIILFSTLALYFTIRAHQYIVCVCVCVCVIFNKNNFFIYLFTQIVIAYVKKIDK